MSVGVGNYQSNEAILAFVALQQGRMYGELEESMTHAELRGQMTSDLNDIKQHLEQANRSKNFSAVDEELQAFVAEYGDVPEFGEINATVKEIADSVHGKWAEALTAQPSAAGVIGPEQPPTAWYEPQTIQSWLGALTGKLDAAGTNDQLTMIHIKQLNDNINQSSSMASELIASRSSTLSAVINNIA